MFSTFARSTGLLRDGWRPKPQDGDDPEPFLADNARPIGDALADFLGRFDPVAAFVDDAGGELHALRHSS